MKKCQHCGKEIQDQNVFCPYCGGKQERNEGPHNANGSPPSGKSLIAMIVGIVAAVVFILVLGAALANRKTTINLNKYMAISFDGYDTMGKAKCEFDADKFEKDYGKKLKIHKEAVRNWLKEKVSEEDLNDFEGLLGRSVEYYYSSFTPGSGTELIKGIVSGTIDPRENLSNGDMVTFSWNISDEDLAFVEACCNCRLKISDITQKVDGLEKVKTFDPFDGAGISFSGIAPDGQLNEIKPGSDAACQVLRYRTDKTRALSNGDTVTVTVTYNGGDPTDYCVGKYGKIPAQTSKEFKVGGLDSYVTSASQISDNALQQMQSQAEDAVSDFIADYGDKYITVADLQYLGNYLITPKEGVNLTGNGLYLVYKVRANFNYSNPESDHKKSFHENVDYYVYCKFHNLLNSDKGETSVDLTKYDMNYSDNFQVDSGVEETAGWSFTKWWYVYGYEKLDVMRSGIVSSNRRYNLEDNVMDVDFDSSPAADEAAAREEQF